MFSMKGKSIEMAGQLRNDCELLVAGGSLPTSNPEEYLSSFDVVAVGEGEETMFEIVRGFENGGDTSEVRGLVYRDARTGHVVRTPARPFIKNLDSIPFPSRDFFDNQSYKHYYRNSFGYTTTSVITSRGCPFRCDFCSRPVFGNDLRSRSAGNIADEVEEVQNLGYDRIWFADDCFTLNRRRLMALCDELAKRKIRIGWECLSRVDTVDQEIVQKMKKAGCIRMFFGIESGNDSVLRLMRKEITVKQASDAVRATKNAGVQVGAFFILGYPGENERTVLDTISFASSLPLDYLSFTLPYPIPGTPLFERVKNQMLMEEWVEPKNPSLVKHKLLFVSPMSEAKLKFAIAKGMIQFEIRKFLGKTGYSLIGTPFEQATDIAFKLMK
jgi:anaerobic magnesium-protoporphyrin IX monomethyl ester cyclase